MNYTYKKLKNQLTNEINTKMILRKEDMLYIPKSEGNRHYQEYLEWVSKGNTPEEAD
tara:strand:- start:264 stop:434 length:171 start_codon:yes stop_codon:yes gene_type:complete